MSDHGDDIVDPTKNGTGQQKAKEELDKGAGVSGLTVDIPKSTRGGRLSPTITPTTKQQPPGKPLDPMDTQTRLTRAKSPTSAPAALFCKIDTQMSRMDSVMMIFDLVNKRKDSVPALMIDAWNQDVRELYSSFKKEHTVLEAHCTAAMVDHEYFTSKIQYKMSALYHNVVLALSKLTVTPSGPVHEPGQTHSLSTGKLPEIKLPTFSGSYADWPTFKELFTGMILNRTDLSDVVKLHYLRSSLSGFPLNWIEGLTLCGDSLKPSWDTLVNRFENKRSLLNNRLDQLNELAPVNSRNPASLNSVITTVSKIRQSLLLLVPPDQLGDCILMHKLSKMLDRTTREAWETSLGESAEIPTFEKMESFLISRVRALEMAGDSINSSRTSSSITGNHGNHHRSTPARVNTSSPDGNSQPGRQGQTSRTTQHPCTYCNEPHYIVTCPKFRTLTETQRRQFVTDKPLCYNCLGAHPAKNCKSNHRCKTCNGNHHTMIHVQKQQPRTMQSYDEASAIAWYDSSVQSHQVRILIDPGSELSFIAKESVAILKIKRQHSSIPIIGVGGTHATHTQGKVNLELRSIYRNVKVRITAHIISQVSSTLPSEECEQVAWNHTKELKLADPTFWKPQPIDVLIGADHYGHIIKPNIIKGSPSEPIAQLSIFGWLLLGPVSSTPSGTRFHHTTITTDVDKLEELLTRFWIQEEPPTVSKVILNADEAACEQHFVQTHTRNSQGKYQVRLPLKENPKILGTSLGKAQACLRRIINKCNTDQLYKERYYSFMQEYINLVHMVKIPADEVHATPAYYLPHHGVLKEDSLTTKLRVVFNGSATTSNGNSLNDIMYTGPNLSPNIVDVLTWMRTHQFVFSTDITKMYRQINVHPENWNLQRILWIDENAQFAHYHLTTVTYGTRAAPYLAIRTLLQLVEDEGHNYPLAIRSITSGRYVDDIFGGADSQEELIQTANQLIKLCTAGGFLLSKWNSNLPELLKEILNKPAADSAVSLDDCATKLLGLQWLPQLDKFTFTLNKLLHTEVNSKRAILSQVSQLFDPLGIISPVVIKAKILLQELWLFKLSWDEPVPSSVEKKWLHIREDLNSLNMISIPRWLGTRSDSIIEIHGSSDASQLAMAAVLFIKSTCVTTGTSSVEFLLAKTKVAPLKRQSIPRLELGAASLVTKLAAHCLSNTQLNITAVHLWTDAKVALAWIYSHPSRWKDFVANRVALIQELIPNAQWRHVPGAENPADCASRGILTSQLASHDLWWYGPSWLRLDSSHWPTQTKSIDISELPEARPKVSFIAATQPRPYSWNFIWNCSSFIRLIRATAWFLIACERFKAKGKSPPVISLTPDDLERAKLFWIKETQQAHFHSELKMLKNSSVPHNHLLNRLTAYVDSTGILRVGGRLNNAQMEYQSKHPAILPRRSPLTTLIIRQAHFSTLHGGTQLTLAHTRQKYWIIGGRAPVKSHILQCVTCARFRAQRAQQLMGQLPKARVTPSLPFSHTGIDYAGPLNIKSWKGRGSKRYKSWICVFVCFSTSAVHLELVSDYSTDGFIAAYRRFTSRRGIPSDLYSDCGTNFVGADKELKSMFRQAQQGNSSLTTAVTTQGTQWHFNPPAASHMGGKWEAVVKSVKYHWKRVVGETLLTFEEATTILAEIEKNLNSRPLEPVSEDPEDLRILTPAILLTGKQLNAIPEPSLLTTADSKLSRWKFLQKLTQQFWKHWSTQYLNRMQSISKWYHPSHEIKVGSMVLITDERTSPTQWPLARVIALKPGSDSLTRVVILKTATTQLERPIAKLAILPILTQDMDQPAG